VTLQRLDPDRHANALYDAYAIDGDGRLWTYLAQGPFAHRSDFESWLRLHAADPTLVSYALVAPEDGRALGIASYLRIDPAMGTIEIGHLCFAPALQRSTAATEALHLLIRHALDELGYRRCEWKCDQLNAASRRAAERLGFRYEGTHRNARVYKGRNRDTAWYSIIDSEWPPLRRSLQAWLAPQNFDADGRQRSRLGSPT
jgi:RimJ/RimL family protein N-acetyltransferase